MGWEKMLHSGLLNITDHARKRMAERQVEEEEVRETIYYPDSTEMGEDGETIVCRKFGKSEIKVAYLSLPNEIRVLTVIKVEKKRG